MVPFFWGFLLWRDYMAGALHWRANEQQNRQICRLAWPARLCWLPFLTEKHFG